MAGQRDEDADPRQELIDAMTKLWYRAGCPPSRTIARSVGGSHTTANSAIKGPTLPSWPVMAKVIEYLKGDPQDFWPLWIVAQTGREGAGSASPVATERNTGSALIAEAIHDLAAAIREFGKPGG